MSAFLKVQKASHVLPYFPATKAHCVLISALTKSFLGSFSRLASRLIRSEKLSEATWYCSSFSKKRRAVQGV